MLRTYCTGRLAWSVHRLYIYIGPTAVRITIHTTQTPNIPKAAEERFTLPTMDTPITSNPIIHIVKRSSCMSNTR